MQQMSHGTFFKIMKTKILVKNINVILHHVPGEENVG